ncbi:U-box domain-containing protein 43-like [Aristolochia californica]|uniref:U-box domain-containing protein 43-like n=1 Tax=Aristolochia californica TaxID=171875 RepID=UPI0035E0A08C
MASAAGFSSPAVDLINRSLVEISSSFENCSFDIPKRFSSYATRLHLLLNQFVRSLQVNPSPAVHTAFKGIASDLTLSDESLSVYRQKSKIYVLINCVSLSKSLQERTVAIGRWLALLDSELVGNSDLRKKIEDLSKDMKQSEFKVTENEERLSFTLQKEAHGRETSKAVQSAIMMDLARAIGTVSENYNELAEQIKLLKADLSGSSSISERRILMSLEKIFETWSITPNSGGQIMDQKFEEDAHIPPFKNFLCPLTKEVMKDPVVLESFQTYERTAIQYWFDRCIEDGRDPTCPVTGQVLRSLTLKPNIGLAGAIEEWIDRNVDMQVTSALEYLREDSSCSVDSVERILDNIYNCSEEYPFTRYKIRKSGIIVLIVKMLQNFSKSIGSLLRSKALMALLSLAKDSESKLIMIEEGMIRLAIHSLTGSLEMEKEYAVKLLAEFSINVDICAKIASQKGALVLLSSITGNPENPILSSLAEEVLRNMEKVEENVQHLAAAGRFQPLLSRLCGGDEDIKIEMASLVGNMTLPSNGKEVIARQGAKVLVNMLSSKAEARASSLRAMLNLSSLDDNAIILVDCAALPALTNILFNQTQDELLGHNEDAAVILANIVSKPGHWELAAGDHEGHMLQSEVIIHKLLGVLSNAVPTCQVAVLQILFGIVSSPQASESAAAHIRSVAGLVTISLFLEHPEANHRLYAFRLTSILSRRLAEPLADELRASNKLSFLKQTLLEPQTPFVVRCEAARILANLPMTEHEVKTVLGTGLVSWTVATLKDQRRSTSSRGSKNTTSMAEGLLGILLHFAKSRDHLILSSVQENCLLEVFHDYLTFLSLPRLKQRAALGLKYISESAQLLTATRDMETQLPRGFCAPFMFLCGRASKGPCLCPAHGNMCDENSGFCLINGQVVKPLADLLHDESRDVQIAAIEALSTLLSDPYSLRGTVDVLEKLHVIDTVTNLFTEVRPGELQERLIWIVEKLLRVEGSAQSYSVDQGLVKALVEAFKHGNANTKRCAQDALTNLKQISGVSGKNSTVSRGRRLGND